MGDKNEQERQKNSRERVMRVQFNAVLKDVTRKGTKIQTDEYLTEGKFPIIDQGNNDIAGYRDDETGLFTDVPAIVFGDHTRIVKYITEPFFLGADGVKVLVPIDRTMNCKYLYYQLLSAKIPDTGYNRHFKWVKELEFQLPSRNEQDDVVKRLDKLCVVISARQQQLAKLDELVKARFVEMFGDISINDKGWDVEPLGILCTIVRGASPRPIEKYLGGDVPWIKISDATHGENIYLNKTKEYIIQEGVSKSRKVKSGSLIFANCGVSLGFARIITFDGCIHDGWLAMEDIDERVNKIFLLQALNQMTEHFREIAPAGTQPNLNTTIMKEYKQIIPPMRLQEEFVGFIERADKLRLQIEKSLEKSETLRKSLMQQYFG